MASLALGIAGSVVGGFFGGPIGASVGGMLGSALGGMLDNVLFPKPAQFVEGPKLSDQTVMASSYGAPIPWIYGPQNRVAVNVIDSSGMIQDYHDNTQKAGGKGGGGQSVTTRTYTYRITLALLIGKGSVGSLARIWANKKVIYDHGAFNVMQEVRLYHGTGVQLPDPDLESIHGVGNAPAYRHSAYLLLKNLQLADFGNAVPQIEVEIEGQAEITVGAVVQDLCAAGGVAPVSVGGLTTFLKGYTIARNSPIIECLQPLALAYNFDAAEQRGDVRFIKRGFGLKAVIPIEEMGVHVAGDDPPDSPYQVDRGTGTGLPKAVTVSYADPDFDLQGSSQAAQRTLGDSNANLNPSLPLVLSSEEARAIADRMLYEAWAARRTGQFNVSDRWIGIAPADVIGMTLAGAVVPFKVTRATRGQDGVTEVEVRYEDSEVYSSVAPGQTPNLPENVFTDVGDTLLYLFNGPLIFDSSNNDGFYWTVAAASKAWRGAEIQRSTDDGDTWSDMNGAQVRGVVGNVDVALGDGPFGFIDEGNSIDVELIYPTQTLASVTESEMLNGVNTAWIGRADGSTGEIIGFRDAELQGPGVYRLSGLLRGRRGTDHAIAGHVADEIFVLLSTQTVGRSEFGPGDWDTPRDYRAASVLTQPEDADVIEFENTGEALRPFAPVHVTGTRDGSNNLTIDWIRRTRLLTGGLTDPVPLGEETESYQVEILDFAGSSVVRTIKVTAPTATYSAAQQTADGIVPGDPVRMIVYQMSAIRGRGHGRSARV